MTPKKSSGNFAQLGDIKKTVHDDHCHILALFQLYLHAPVDQRQAIVDRILDRLASHLQMEEESMYADLRHTQPERRHIVETALLDHDEIKAMMSELQESETDDDQALDEFFEDMMQTVREHFAAEERDMFPLIDG